MKLILKFYSLIFVIIQLISFVISNSYNIELTKYQILSQSKKEWVDFGTFRLAKIDRNTFALSGTANLNKNIGNNEKISYAAYTKPAYKKEFSDKPLLEKIFNACDFIENDKILYAELTEKSNLPKTPTCPLPKGSYTFNNWSYNPENLPNFIPPGDYKVLFKVMSNTNELLFGIEVHGTVSMG